MQYTPEQLEDISVRKDVFLEGYKKLRDECEIDFVAFPVFSPNTRGTFDVVLQNDLADLKYTSMPSPFIDAK